MPFAWLADRCTDFRQQQELPRNSLPSASTQPGGRIYQLSQGPSSTTSGFDQTPYTRTRSWAPEPCVPRGRDGSRKAPGGPAGQQVSVSGSVPPTIPKCPDRVGHSNGSG